MVNKVQQLIQQILADKKLKNGQNFQEKIYRDEPILHTAAQMANYLPPEYRQMKKIAISREAFSQPAEWLFYQQGKLMENFEDDCPYRGEFMRYYPTYHTMYDDQLRGYFTWRAAVRHGRIEKTSLSFVFLYIYELLNQIGVHSPEEGFDTLYAFWQQYRALDPRLDRYVRQWLGDYVAYYGLDSGLVSRFTDASFDENLLILLHAADREESEIFNALMALSSYRIENSKFYKQYPAEVCRVAVAVFTAWSNYCEKTGRKPCWKNCSAAGSPARTACFSPLYSMTGGDTKTTPMHSTRSTVTPVRMARGLAKNIMAAAAVARNLA